MTSPNYSQEDIDRENKRFWNELCGSQFARVLGISDDSPASLRRFDDWFMGFYPYLRYQIPFAQMTDRRVLEIGLGYGTVAQRLMETGAVYHGLDIAAGPVHMAAHRARQLGVEATLVQGSLLSCPFRHDSFDWVVTIGCLHHTGGMARAIGEVHRVLKPHGRAVMMVYNATSYRHWRSDFRGTLKRQFARAQDYRTRAAAPAIGRAYDVNEQGKQAPQTEFVTERELAFMCREFAQCRIVRENIGSDGWFTYWPRTLACRLFGPLLGLDLYCHVTK